MAVPGQKYSITTGPTQQNSRIMVVTPVTNIFLRLCLQIAGEGSADYRRLGVLLLLVFTQNSSSYQRHAAERRRISQKTSRRYAGLNAEIYVSGGSGQLGPHRRHQRRRQKNIINNIPALRPLPPQPKIRPHPGRLPLLRRPPTSRLHSDQTTPRSRTFQGKNINPGGNNRCNRPIQTDQFG